MALADPPRHLAPEVRTVRSDRWPEVAVLLVAAVAGLAGAVVADAAPTGLGWADVAWRIGLVATCAWAGRRDRREVLLVAGAVVVAAGGGAVGVVAGVAAVGVAALAPRRSDAAGVLGGALLGVGLLHLGWPGGFGRSALLAALVVAVLVVAARPGRRPIGIGVGVLGLAAVVVGLAGWRLLGERAALVHAVSAGEDALVAARDGDVATAQAEFGRARSLLDEVDLDAAPVSTLRVLPVAGQHLVAVRRMVATARRLAVVAGRTLEAADVDRLRPADGRIDPAALRSVDTSLTELVGALSRARSDARGLRSPWLVHPLTSRLDRFELEAGRAVRDAKRVGQGLDVATELLGVDGPKRYFLAVMTPAELRSAGGYVGNWGIVTADGGHVSLSSFARASELQGAGGYRISVDPQFDDRYVRGWGLGTWPQNLTASPDLGAGVEVARQVLQQRGDGDVDGMLVVDPLGMAALLHLTGPVEVPGWNEPFSSTNAARVLLFDQYQHASDPRRPELLAAVTHALFDRLVTGPLPGVGDIVDALGPAVAQGHLQVISRSAEATTFLRANGLDHSLRPATGDGVQLVTQNVAQSKLDWFLRRSLDYELAVDPRTGAATGTATVTLTNTAPARGLPIDYYSDTYHHLPLGLDVQVVSLYAGLETTAVEVDGAAVEVGRGVEQGHHVTDRFVRIPAGATATVVFHLEGRLALPGGRYRLALGRQPTVAPDQVRVVVNGHTLVDGPQDTPRTLSLGLG